MSWHLLHPALVHFTVAFLLVGAATLGWALVRDAEGLERFGNRLYLIGAASLVLTLFSGFLAENTILPVAGTEPLIAAHERNGWIVGALVLASLLWRAWNRGELPRSQRRPYAVLLFTVAAMLTWGAWLGGQLVYRHGVGVG